jgi:hypothetical protein
MQSMLDFLYAVEKVKVHDANCTTTSYTYYLL